MLMLCTSTLLLLKRFNECITGISMYYPLHIIQVGKFCNNLNKEEQNHQ